jgi:hypothetical protein
MTAEYIVTNGTYYDKGTDAAVIQALEAVRAEDTRVRLFRGNTETGEAWSDEYEVCGYIGRSVGPICVPILLNNKRSRWGGAVLTGSIVGVQYRTRSGAIAWTYKHPRLNLGEWTWHPADAEAGKHAEARRDGKLHARFATEEQARRYCLFMQGKRFRAH